MGQQMAVRTYEEEEREIQIQFCLTFTDCQVSVWRYKLCKWGGSQNVCFLPLHKDNQQTILNIPLLWKIDTKVITLTYSPCTQHAEDKRHL